MRWIFLDCQKFSNIGKTTSEQCRNSKWADIQKPIVKQFEYTFSELSFCTEVSKQRDYVELIASRKRTLGNVLSRPEKCCWNCDNSSINLWSLNFDGGKSWPSPAYLEIVGHIWIYNSTSKGHFLGSRWLCCWV